MTDLDRWRQEFPILSRTVYMISNSLGAVPRQAADHLAEYAHTWATPGVRGWEAEPDLSVRTERVLDAIDDSTAVVCVSMNPTIRARW